MVYNTYNLVGMHTFNIKNQPNVCGWYNYTICIYQRNIGLYAMNGKCRFASPMDPMGFESSAFLSTRNKCQKAMGHFPVRSSFGLPPFWVKHDFLSFSCLYAYSVNKYVRTHMEENMVEVVSVLRTIEKDSLHSDLVEDVPSTPTPW